MPLQGPTVSAHLLVQSASVAAPMLVPGIFLPPGTGAPITMQGPAFPPMASTLLLFPRVPAVPALMQSAAMPPMTSSPLRARLTLVHTWPLQLGQCVCLVTCLSPRYSSPLHKLNLKLLALQSQELEARELEVERRTRSLNQDAVKGAETKSAAPSVRSSRTYTVDSLLITRLKFCEFLILGHLRWFNFC